MFLRKFVWVCAVAALSAGCGRDEPESGEAAEQGEEGAELATVSLRQPTGTASAWAVAQVPGNEPGTVARYVVENASDLRRMSSAATGYFAGEGSLELALTRMPPGTVLPLLPPEGADGQAQPTDGGQVGYGEHSRKSGEASQERQLQGQTGTFDPDSKAGPQPHFAYAWAPTAGGRLEMRMPAGPNTSRTVTIEPLRPASSPAGGSGVARHATDAQLAREPSSEDTGTYSGYFVANVHVDGRLTDPERLVYLSALPDRDEGQFTMHVYVLPIGVQPGPAGQASTAVLQPLQASSELPVGQGTRVQLPSAGEREQVQNRDLPPPKTIEPGGPETVDQPGRQAPQGGAVSQPQGRPPAEGWHQALHLVFPGVRPVERTGS